MTTSGRPVGEQLVSWLDGRGDTIASRATRRLAERLPQGGPVVRVGAVLLARAAPRVPDGGLEPVVGAEVWWGCDPGAAGTRRVLAFTRHCRGAAWSVRLVGPDDRRR